MCFELDSLPPIPALSGGAPVRSEDLTLRAADGNEFAAFAAIPDEPGAVGVVVLPDVRGLYRFYEELALRFGERGYPAVAFDYFGRTAGVGKRDDEFPYMDHVALTTPEGIQQDVRAAVEYLRSPAGGGCTEIFTVGFCFGGRNSWLAAAGGHGLAGAIGFYGSTVERNGAPGPTQRAAEFEAPILALQAGDDANILPEHNAAFDAALDGGGRRARARRLRRRSPQLLRPQVRGARRRVGRRLGAGARVHRAALVRRQLTVAASPVRDALETGGSRTSRAAGKRGSR